MASPNLTDEPNQAADTHLESYCSHFRVCIGKLRSIWKQVGNEPDDCHSQVMVAAEQALAAWTQAVERAEAERISIKAFIQQHSSEIASIKAELDDGVDAQSAVADVNNEDEATLLRTLEALKSTLQFWRLKRASRVQAYEALMDLHVSLKKQLGLKHQPVDDVDITTGALEYLQMENGKLQEEKARRISRAEDELDKLRTVCRELGEDSSAAAAEVHPALSSLSAEKESAEVLGNVYKLVGSPSHLSVGCDLDLSDAIFERLAAKVADMQRLKAEREAQSRDVLEMLGSLWDALSIPEDAPERSMVHKMLSLDRPQRLHKRTLDKCLAEVNRLEGCKAQAMRDLALAKARELEQLCISTRISPPHTGPLLAELDKQGQMTQVLSKLVRLVAEVQAMAAKRAPILVQVTELLAAQADSAWLRSYSQNENRYKGRDASRNMQRAIKAAKLRERLGPMMEGLLTSLAEWEIEEGGPFLYDEQVLQDTHLKAVEAELEQLAVEKVPKPKASSAAASGAATSATPASGASRPPTASRPASSSHGTGPASRAGAHGASGGAAGGASGTSCGAPRAPAASSGGASTADNRPSPTPRSNGMFGAGESGSRRSSLVPSSARDASTFGGRTGSGSATHHLFTAAGLGGAAAAPAGGKVVMRSNDFAPGALRALAATATAPSDRGAAGPAQTPPGPAHRRASLGIAGAGFGAAVSVAASPAHTSAASPMVSGAARGRTGAAAAAAALAAAAPGIAAEDSGGDDVTCGNNNAAAGGGFKNSAQDLFRRYLGDPSDVSNRATPTKATASPSPATRPVAKLSFSGAAATAAPAPASAATSVTTSHTTPGMGVFAGGEDDGADDVRATKCDTPKSTASSRSRQSAQQQQQKPSTKTSPAAKQGITAGSTGFFSPEGKVSRIPRVRI